MEAAWCALNWVTLLGATDPMGRAAADDARALFERGQSAALLALLDRALAAEAVPQSATEGVLQS
jgi:hypothetical protein